MRIQSARALLTSTDMRPRRSAPRSGPGNAPERLVRAASRDAGRLPLLLLLGATALAGCWSTLDTRPSPPPAPPAPDGRWESQAPPPRAPAGRGRTSGEQARPSQAGEPGEDGAPQTRPAGGERGGSPRVLVEQARSLGAENARRAERLAARSKARIRGCLAEPGTRARIVIHEEPLGTIRAEVLPLALATPATLECIREALSESQTDDVTSRGSPSDQPSGFTAQFRVEW